MTNVTVRPASTGQNSVPLEELLLLGGRLLTLSLENSLQMLRQTSSVLPALSASVPALRLRPAADACCTIPEVDCPPRCVCQVRWEAAPGETPGLSVRVTNSSSTGRTFSLHATPFIGAGGSIGSIALAPPTLSLGAGETGFVNATYTVPNADEGDYDAEVVIRGAFEQAVCITLDLRCAKTRGQERGVCTVVQGDPPVRIRAHHWYDHFQCSEPCVEHRQRIDPADQSRPVIRG